MMPAPVRRGRDPHEAHRVSTPLELLFDLSFVVAIALAAAQLHHGEAGHHWQVAPQYLAAFFGIWWAWMNYTWYASAYDNDDLWAATVGYALMRLALPPAWFRPGFLVLVVPACLACIAAVPVAVTLGLPLPWALVARAIAPSFGSLPDGRRLTAASAGKPYTLLIPRIGEIAEIGNTIETFPPWWEGVSP